MRLLSPPQRCLRRAPPARSLPTSAPLSSGAAPSGGRTPTVIRAYIGHEGEGVPRPSPDTLREGQPSLLTRSGQSTQHAVTSGQRHTQVLTEDRGSVQMVRVGGYQTARAHGVRARVNRRERPARPLGSPDRCAHCTRRMTWSAAEGTPADSTHTRPPSGGNPRSVTASRGTISA